MDTKKRRRRSRKQTKRKEITEKHDTGNTYKKTNEQKNYKTNT